MKMRNAKPAKSVRPPTAVTLVEAQNEKLRAAALAGARCHSFDYDHESAEVIHQMLIDLGFKVEFNERTDWKPPPPGEPGDRGEALIRKSVMVRW